LIKPSIPLALGGLDSDIGNAFIHELVSVSLREFYCG